MECVHALTDVTVFVLLGHLIEMAEGSGLSALVHEKDIPLIEGLHSYIAQMIVPDSLYRNWNSYQSKVRGVNGPSFIPLCDPQTSGGLLVAVDPRSLEDFMKVVKESGITTAFAPIGKITDKKAYVVEVKEQG